LAGKPHIFDGMNKTVLTIKPFLSEWGIRKILLENPQVKNRGQRMPAFLLIALAIFTRVMPHAGWLNFTAVGGSLLYFGARRPVRTLWIPVLVLMATDYYLTKVVYGYTFLTSSYLLTWAWYAGVALMGRGLLGEKTTTRRVVAAGLLGPTSFFLLSNFAMWTAAFYAPTTSLYPASFAGLISCYVAGIPFYQNDLASTLLVVGVAFGAPVLVRNMKEAFATNTSI
jgi:hypothetical protein